MIRVESPHRQPVTELLDPPSGIKSSWNLAKWKQTAYKFRLEVYALVLLTQENVTQRASNIGSSSFVNSSSSLAGLNSVRMAGALRSWSFSKSGPFQTTSTAFVRSSEHATKSKPPRIGYVPFKREARILQAETELMSFQMGKG
jgi:hypothetical protein